MVLSDKNHEPIIQALMDYRKWFEDKDDKEKLQNIDCAIASLNRENINFDCFPITYISKDDIIHAFPNNSEVKTIVNKLDDADMKHLASKLADDYCEQLFWESLRIIFEANYL